MLDEPRIALAEGITVAALDAPLATLDSVSSGAGMGSVTALAGDAPVCVSSATTAASAGSRRSCC